MPAVKVKIVSYIVWCDSRHYIRSKEISGPYPIVLVPRAKLTPSPVVSPKSEQEVKIYVNHWHVELVPWLLYYFAQEASDTEFFVSPPNSEQVQRTASLNVVRVVFPRGKVVEIEITDDTTVADVLEDVCKVCMAQKPLANVTILQPNK